MKKRLISGIIVLAVAVLTIPLLGLSPAFAAKQHGELSYQKFGGNKQIRITYCDTSATGELVVPDFIEGKPVTAIGDSAFRDCADLTAVVLPEGIKSIESYAFYGCAAQTRVLVPESVTSIGKYAFGFQTGRNKRPVITEGFLLYCYPDSAALDYAVKYGIPYSIVPSLTLIEKSELSEETDMKIVFSKSKMTADRLLEQFAKPGIGMGVYKNGKRLSGEAFTGTGCEIRLTDGALMVDKMTLAVAGDLNGDGAVDALDTFLCGSAINRHLTLKGAYYAAADLDKTGSGLNIGDLSAIMNRAVNKQ